MTTCKGERGQVAGIEALPFGVLVFVAGGLLILNIWGVVDTKFAADAAAREATRYVVEASGAATTPAAVRAGAQRAARQTFADHGKRSTLVVDVRGDGWSFERCDRVRVEVRTSVPAIRLPFVGGFGDAFDVVASHAELVDPTRSGVDGRADCIR